MKNLFAGTMLFSLLSFPATASSIEYIDEMITGPKGTSSILSIGEPEKCTEAACVDPTGGDPALSTASAQQRAAIAAMPPRKINFEFARRFPDPASPVPTSAPVEGGGSAEPGMVIPQSPVDSGTIAPQMPVGGVPNSPPPGAVPFDAAAGSGNGDGTRGSIDPNGADASVADASSADSGAGDPSAPQPAAPQQNGIIVVPRQGL